MQHGRRKWLPLSIIGFTGLLVSAGLVVQQPQRASAGVFVPYYQSVQQRSVTISQQTVQKKAELILLLRVGTWSQVNVSIAKSVSDSGAADKAADAETEKQLKKRRLDLDNLQQELSAKKPVQVASVPRTAQVGEGDSPPQTPIRPQASRGGGEVSKLIDRALSLRGIPYKWGGTTRDGFDCSGFVQYVLKASGISMPRTSFEQYKVGNPVSRGQLQPGDLVFFSTYSRGPSDVRIYIGGGQTVGSSSGGVEVHSLSEAYWSSHYFGARRISF